MELAVLLSVFVAITQTIVVARPTDIEEDDVKTKDSMPEEPQYVPEKIHFTLPTKIKHGIAITINGTMNLKHPRLTALFTVEGANDSGVNDDNQCRITYDLENEKFMVKPTIPDAMTEVDYGVYETEGREDNIKFSIMIQAHEKDELLDNRFKVIFEADAGGEVSLYCKINNFTDFNSIVFQEGVNKITSLLFEFN